MPAIARAPAFRIFTVLASFTLAMAGAEGLARLGLGQREPPLLAADPVLGWDSLPPLRQLNPGRGRPILFLGDSFTQNSRWPGAVLQKLREQGKVFSGLEGAVSGHGTYQQLKKFERVLEVTRPSALVMQFYAWNDLRDNWAWPALGYNPEMLARPYLSPEGEEFWPDYPWKWLDEFKITSYFGKRSLVRAWQKADRIMRTEGVNAIASRRQALVAGLCTDEAWQPFYLPSAQEGPLVGGAWQVTQACLARLAKGCREMKIPLLVLALDAPFTVDEDKWRFLRERHPDLDRDLPLLRLRRLLAEENIPAVFPQDVLREWSASTGQSAYDGDAESLIGHLTPGAQEIVAREVSARLVGLLPPTL